MIDPAFIRQIAPFNTAAKLTHASYGTSSPPAQRDRFQNAISVARTTVNEFYSQESRIRFRFNRFDGAWHH